MVTYILISLNHLVTNRTLTFDLLFFYFFRNRLLSRLETCMFVFKPARYHFFTIHTLNAFHHFIWITFKSRFQTLTFYLLCFCYFMNQLLSRLLTYMFVFKPVRYHFITIHTFNAFHHFILITFKSKFRLIIFDLLFFCYFRNQLLSRPETYMFVFEPARYNFFTIHTFNSFNYFIWFTYKIRFHFGLDLQL